MSEFLSNAANAASTWAIPIIFLIIVGAAAIKKVKVYEVFVEGAKEGFNVGVKIIPYLVAILAAIAVFRGSGALDWSISILRPLLEPMGVPPEVLPMALMRPLSGSGALGVMTEGLETYGPDSLIGNMLSTMMGSTETTFYVLAVYFGSVGIRRARHALPACLIGDFAGIVSAIFICKLVF
ncbi:spore maturation protein [bacterium]|nr:spore maturation protein [bacterium]MBU1637568.1 spore maturation protein [bacterium]MBU1920993.1 spore maturation protein [bacterium]